MTKKPSQLDREQAKAQERAVTNRDRKIAAMIRAAWRGNMAIVATVGLGYLVCDRFAAYAISGKNSVLDSRQMFPSLPSLGETIVQAKDDAVRSRIDLVSYWKKWVELDLRGELVVPSPWVKDHGMRLFRGQSRNVFLDQKYLDPFGSTTNELCRYQFRSAKDAAPVLVSDPDGLPTALIMPLFHSDQRDQTPMSDLI